MTEHTIKGTNIKCFADYYSFGMEDGLLNKENANIIKKPNYSKYISKKELEQIIINNGYYNEWIPFIESKNNIIPIGIDDVIIFIGDEKKVLSEKEFNKFLETC